ncbi:hypothetical protein NPIL_595121, partial [Nephila pilipes]
MLYRKSRELIAWYNAHSLGKQADENNIPGKSTGLGRRGHRINLADVLSKEFEPRVFNGTWIS